ncbi:MAG TPA: hypothetical protein VIV60_14760 [Polyangiaceae bacterium]
MKRSRWVFGAIVGMALGWQTGSYATLVQAIPLADLIELSESVVVATVVDSTSHYATVRGHRRMVTDTTLLVDHVITAKAPSAAPAQSIHVRTLGGTSDGVVQSVLGEAVLETQSTNLLFLRRGSDGELWVAAMAQGEYPLENTADGQSRLHASPGLDVVRNPEQSVVSVLSGTTLQQAETLVKTHLPKARH